MHGYRAVFATVALGACCSMAQAQDDAPAFSVGVRAWYTEWTTFSYFAPGGVNQALTQVSAEKKLALVPVASARWGPWSASVSAFPSTDFSFHDGGGGTRREADVNVGYAVLPSLSVSLGYKWVSQRDGDTRYEPKGPVLGLNGNASLDGPWSLYGSLGLGRLRTPGTGGPEVVKFKSDYRLTEVGVAYSLSPGTMPRRWTFTAGYRIQVMSSDEAFGTQDGRDTTEGLTFGALATF